MVFQFDNERPIYLQLVEQLRQAIVARVFLPGDRLPSVRELSLKAKVNPNTMQKALSELESAGLIFTERTNGKFVTTNESTIDEVRSALASKQVHRYLHEMQKIGISYEDAVAYLTKEGH